MTEKLEGLRSEVETLECKVSDDCIQRWEIRARLDAALARVENLERIPAILGRATTWLVSPDGAEIHLAPDDAAALDAALSSLPGKDGECRRCAGKGCCACDARFLTEAAPADVAEGYLASERKKGCYLSTLELHELDEACAPFLSAFGTHPYLVGSASERPDFRDVDVRLILADDEFDALFTDRKALWALLSRLGSTHLRAKTGLPVDFQVQRQTEANEKYGDLGKTPRNPLGSRGLLDFAGGGDAAGDEEREAT